MAFSSASPRITARPERKVRSQPALWSVAFIFFVLGAAASTLTIWQLNKLYKATVAPVVTVEGSVQAKYSYQDSNEATPAPNGYFVESPGVGRVYLTGRPMDSYVGQRVDVEGSMSSICGPKSIPCFPMVEVRDVSESAAE